MDSIHVDIVGEGGMVGVWLMVNGLAILVVLVAILEVGMVVGVEVVVEVVVVEVVEEVVGCVCSEEVYNQYHDSSH